MCPTLDLQVGASDDDCLVEVANTSTAPHSFTTLSTTLSALRAGELGTVRYGAGVRFTNVTIGQGDTIDVAYWTIPARQNLSTTVVRTDIYGENADDAAAYTTVADYNARAKLTVVVWDGIEAWTYAINYNSPSLVVPMQAIVNRAGWVSGNAMGWKWEDGDSDDEAQRRSNSYDATPQTLQLFHIEYTASGGLNAGVIRRRVEGE